MNNSSIPPTPAPDNDKLALALEFLGRGFSVIPLKPCSKQPLVPWEQYQTRRATVEELTRWFSGTRNNMGIVTGAISGVALVDCDSPESLDYAHKNFPSHQRTRTPKGEHFWFRHPGVPVRNSVNLHGIKLDIRGDGGYVVAPGSTHPNGMPYGKEGVWGPTSTLPEFPSEILSVPAKPSGRDQHARDWLATISPAVQGMSGDARTYQVCCRLARGYAMDEDTALTVLEDWNKTCLPPWSARDLRSKLRTALKSGTEEIGAYAEIADQEWRNLLDVDRNGNARHTPANLEVIFENDARFKGSLAHNAMTQGVYWNAEPAYLDFEWKIYVAFTRHWGMKFTQREVVNAATSAAYANTFHPVKQMFEELPPWDHQPRIERIVPEILKADNTPLHQAMMRGFLVGAIRRVLQPGVKLDTALVLVGPQGAGKSTFFWVIGGKFFSDTPLEAESKDRFLGIHGAWILELAELDGMTSAKTAQHIKGLLSSPSDAFRPPYGRAVITAQRSGVMVGTTNTNTFLMDSTGSRRFWPIEVGNRMDTNLLREWRDQILAEAIYLESCGVPHWLDAEFDAHREDASEGYTAHDPWEDSVRDALRRVAESGVALMDGVSTKDIFDRMDLPLNARTRGADMRLAGILRKNGWAGRRLRRDGSLIRLWFPTIRDPASVETPAQNPY